MEVRDPIHGSIPILNEEVPIIEHPFFQRLRGIKQLGFSDYVFPGATHTRYIHSIGVYHITTMIFDSLFQIHKKTKELLRLRETVRLAALLHDIGHAPLSHSTEMVMPKQHQLALPKQYMSKKKVQANHEDYTILAITNSSLTPAFKKVIKKFGVDPDAIAQLINGNNHSTDYFTYQGINYFPLLHQLISSEMDCDRMDYLLRDSYFCGVSYGRYDLDWIIANLVITTDKKHAYLGLAQKAIVTFDDFLLSRFHMFLMVYFHYRAVCLEQIMFRYFSSTDNTYSIPANIEDYLEHDDHFLYRHLRQSHNKWAKSIVHNRIPPKIIEVFGQDKERKIPKLKSMLEKKGIDYILCESSGRLSKYYSSDNLEKYHIKVIAEQNKLININEATDLYERYSQHHSVIRIHIEKTLLTDKLKKDIAKILH